MRTLVFAAHMDDEAISCGALIADRIRQYGPESVFVQVLFSRSYNYGVGPQFLQEQVSHFSDSLQLLGGCHSDLSLLPEGEPELSVGRFAVLEILESRLELFQPTEVVIPSPHDLNQDHRWLYDQCAIALRPANLGSVTRILMAHGLDGGFPCSANWFFSPEESMFKLKYSAIAAYTREVRSAPHPRSYECLASYHKIAGSKIGENLAEPYTLYLEKA